MQPRQIKKLIMSVIATSILVATNSHAASPINQPAELQGQHPTVQPIASAPGILNSAINPQQATQQLVAPMPKPNAVTYPSMSEVSKWYNLANTIESKKGGQKARQKANWADKAFYEYLGSVEGVNKGQIKYLGQSITVTEGDTLMGYKVSKIEPFTVQLKKGKETLTLTPEHEDAAPLQQGSPNGMPPSPSFGGSPMAQMLH